MINAVPFYYERLLLLQFLIIFLLDTVAITKERDTIIKEMAKGSFESTFARLKSSVPVTKVNAKDYHQKVRIGSGRIDVASTIASTSSRNQVPKKKTELCYCNYNDEICQLDGGCFRDRGAACFHLARREYNAETRSMETIHLFGCAPLEAEYLRRADNNSPSGSALGSHFTCNSGKSPHSVLIGIACCYEGNYCNFNLSIPGFIETELSEEKIPRIGHVNNRGDAMALGFLLLGCLLGICLVISVLSIYKYAYRKEHNISIWFKRLRKESDSLLTKSQQSDIKNENDIFGLYYQESTGSGSGSGAITLNQRTIANDLVMLEVVARGRYGCIHKAVYRGTVVAVKTFITTEEESWRNERDIYQTQMLNHQNILQYVAADISSNLDSMTQMLLITDYHPYGSLYDYLRRNEALAIEEVIAIALSTISGIEHLHNPVQGTGGRRKPEIAHRDIKSKNVIVKGRGICCIADFGLAVRCENHSIIPNNVNIQVGTKRYMAPEVLDKTLNVECFDEFKFADIYSFSLVIWEIINMCEEDIYKSRNTQPPKRENDRTISERTCRSSSSGIGTWIDNKTIESNDTVNSGTDVAARTKEKAKSSKNYAVKEQCHDGMKRHIDSDEQISNFCDSESKDFREIVQNSSETEEFFQIPAMGMDNYYTCSRINYIHPTRRYMLPYETLVDYDPSIEQMRKLICGQKLRPPIFEHLNTNATTKRLCDLMVECWSEKARSRHTALKLKKDLIAISLRLS